MTRGQYLLALLCASFAVAQPDGGGQLIDRVVAAVNGDAITLTQLELETRIIFVWEGGVRASSDALDHEALVVGLDEIVADLAAVYEAERIDAYTLEPGELDAAVDKVRQALGPERFTAMLAKHDAELDDVRRVLERRLRATKVWDGRLRVKAQVTDAEVTRYQAEHPEVSTMSAPTLRRLLYRRRYEQLKGVELKQIKRQLDVRLMGPFAPRPESR